RFPPGCVVRGMRYCIRVLNVFVEYRKRSAVEVVRRDRGIGPARLRDVEGVRHWRNTRVMHAEWGQAQDFFDRPEHADRRVRIGYDRTLLYIRSNDESKTAVATDVIGAILGIVFNHEDERVAGVGAVGDLIGRQSYRVVVVGHLKFRRVHTETSGAEVAEVVMIISQQGQSWECIVLSLLVEFPRPFRVAEEVGVALIERPEAGI